jgi:hypothetical protein
MPEGVYTVQTDLGVLTATLSFTVTHEQATSTLATVDTTTISGEFNPLAKHQEMRLKECLGHMS